MTDQRPAIGIDLGATKIAAALVSPGGEILSSRRALTVPGEGPDAVMSRLAAEINHLVSESPGPVAGIGIGSPGRIDSKSGVIRDAVNMGWDKLNLVNEVKARLEQALPIFLDKDTNAAALGEYYFGAGKGCRDFVFLSVGSGLGAGIIANGHIFSGAFGQASELGHLSLNPHGRLCICGLKGCTETVVSGPGLVAATRDLLLKINSPMNAAELDELTPAKILNAARTGESWAREALDEVGVALGAVLAVCVSVLNPARFVIGGGLGLAAFNYLVPSARQEMTLRVPRSIHRDLPIVSSCLESSAMGAACLVWQ